MPKVYVNGSLVDEDAATISVFDHGLVVGDGVFETILVHRGRPFALRRHLDRLARSAGGLRIDCPERDVLERAVKMTIEASRQESGRIRITLTAGRGPLGSGRCGEAPTLEVLAQQYSSKGVAFLGDDVADTPVNALAFDQSVGITYPSVTDPGYAVVQDFSQVAPVSDTPTTVVIDRTGHVAGMVLGEATYAEMTALLRYAAVTK